MTPMTRVGLVLLAIAGGLQAAPLWNGQGRIAISADGNEHDHDDWAATPLSLALLAAHGLQDKLVLYTYSDHVWGSGGFEGRGRLEMTTSALKGSQQFEFDSTLFLAAVDDPKAAYQAMARVIDDSSEGNPLFILAAGPMQVVGEGLERAAPDKRRFVTVISHSDWNNQHSDHPSSGEDPHDGWTWDEMKEAFASPAHGGTRFIKIADQNGGSDYPGLNTDRSDYAWLKSSPHRDRPPYNQGSWDWLYSRLETCLKNGGKNFDPSDAGMVVFLLTGVEKTDPTMVRELMENPQNER